MGKRPQDSNIRLSHIRAVAKSFVVMLQGGNHLLKEAGGRRPQETDAKCPTRKQVCNLGRSLDSAKTFGNRSKRCFDRRPGVCFLNEAEPRMGRIGGRETQIRNPSKFWSLFRNDTLWIKFLGFDAVEVNTTNSLSSHRGCHGMAGPVKTPRAFALNSLL